MTCLGAVWGPGVVKLLESQLDIFHQIWKRLRNYLFPPILFLPGLLSLLLPSEIPIIYVLDLLTDSHWWSFTVFSVFFLLLSLCASIEIFPTH